MSAVLGPVEMRTAPEQGVRWHPYADIFPWIEGAAFRELVDDIRKRGVLEPVVMLDDAVLDGRNRYMAAREAGVEYPVAQYLGDDPLGFVIAKNLTRRHLNESQRAMAAAKLAKLPLGANQHTQASANLRTLEASERLNVSPRSVETARQVERDGVPELAAAVESGAVSVSAASEVAKLPEHQQREIVAEGPAAVREAAKHVRGTFGTGDNEWFTPSEHIARARAVLGTIDLDPATDPRAQETVKASKFYTAADDGLTKEWHGRVWMNPPYAQPAISQFIDKLVSEVESGRCIEAIALTHNYTDTAWFQKAAASAKAICFTRGRIRFVAPDGTLAAPTQGQAFLYFGRRPYIFAQEFRDVGFVAIVQRAFDGFGEQAA